MNLENVGDILKTQCVNIWEKEVHQTPPSSVRKEKQTLNINTYTSQKRKENNMTLMVTGQRQMTPAGWTGNPWPANNPTIMDWHSKIQQLIYNHVYEYATTTTTTTPEFITGMALGADTLFAKAVLSLNVPYALHAAVPFKGQESIWPAHAKAEYNSILTKCSSITLVCDPGYAAWKMQVRNKWMVDRAHDVLAVWTGKKGGTYNCIAAAKSMNRAITILNPSTLTIT